jgi:hypothetical protein
MRLLWYSVALADEDKFCIEELVLYVGEVIWAVEPGP